MAVMKKATKKAIRVVAQAAMKQAEATAKDMGDAAKDAVTKVADRVTGRAKQRRRRNIAVSVAGVATAATVAGMAIARSRKGKKRR